MKMEYCGEYMERPFIYTRNWIEKLLSALQLVLKERVGVMLDEVVDV